MSTDASWLEAMAIDQLGAPLRLGYECHGGGRDLHHQNRQSKGKGAARMILPGIQEELVF